MVAVHAATASSTGVLGPQPLGLGGMELQLCLGQIPEATAGAYGSAGRVQFLEEVTATFCQNCGDTVRAVSSVVGTQPGTPRHRDALTFHKSVAAREVRQRLADLHVHELIVQTQPVVVCVEEHECFISPGCALVTLRGLPSDWCQPGAIPAILASAGYADLEILAEYGVPWRLPDGTPHPTILRGDIQLAMVRVSDDDCDLHRLPRKFHYTERSFCKISVKPAPTTPLQPPPSSFRPSPAATATPNPGSARRMRRRQRQRGRTSSTTTSPAPTPSSARDPSPATAHPAPASVAQPPPGFPFRLPRQSSPADMPAPRLLPAPDSDSHQPSSPPPTTADLLTVHPRQPSATHAPICSPSHAPMQLDVPARPPLTTPDASRPHALDRAATHAGPSPPPANTPSPSSRHPAAALPQPQRLGIYLPPNKRAALDAPVSGQPSDCWGHARFVPAYHLRQQGWQPGESLGQRRRLTTALVDPLDAVADLGGRASSDRRCLGRTRSGSTAALAAQPDTLCFVPASPCDSPPAPAACLSDAATAMEEDQDIPGDTLPAACMLWYEDHLAGTQVARHVQHCAVRQAYLRTAHLWGCFEGVTQVSQIPPEIIAALRDALVQVTGDPDCLAHDLPELPDSPAALPSLCTPAQAHPRRNPARPRQAPRSYWSGGRPQ